MEDEEVSAIQNEAKNVTLWIAEGAEDFDLRCHFWCSENGDVPIRKRDGRAETEVEITPEILQEIVSDHLIIISLIDISLMLLLTYINCIDSPKNLFFRVAALK